MPSDRAAPRPPLLRVPATVVAIAAMAALAACTPALPGPSASARPGPSATARIPTPVPTVPATPGPTATPEPLPVGLVVRLTSCSHTCAPAPGTTILDDGRIIWEDAENRASEARLTPDALQRVLDAIDVPELDETGDYQARLRPGAEPAGRGATLYRLEVLRGGRRVMVTFGDPAAYADEPDLWVIPPEMTALATIAGHLQLPVAWLGQPAFAEGPDRYEADRYLVVIDLFPEVGEDLGFDADVDKVDWPFGAPIEGAGEPVASEGGFGTRCVIVDASDAEAMVAAEEAAGAHRQRGLWRSTVEYRWKRADGFVQVALRPLLPHERASCVELAAEGP